MKLRIGFSGCPNDTFACHAILERKVDRRGLDLEIDFLPVQELNEQLAKETFDFSKASSHAALHASQTYGVLRTGASFGMGSGPLLLAAREHLPLEPQSLVLCPGQLTTGTLLFRCLYPDVVCITHRKFWEIIPALKCGNAPFGVVIHEGRFTYRQQGLALVADLGVRWQTVTDGPVPLGVVLGKLSLPRDVRSRFHQVLCDSLAYALANRAETLATMRRFAHDFDEAVIWSYVDLYVNRYTLELDGTAQTALTRLALLARRAGLVASSAPPLRCID